MTSGTKDFFAGNDKPEADKALTRTGIMLVLAPAISAALGTISGFTLDNVAHLRRTVRAIAHVAIKLMLDAGAPPQVVAATLIEALAHEVEERAKVQAAAEAASANVPAAQA